MVKRVVVVQKERKRKKVPRWARTAELPVLLNSAV